MQGRIRVDKVATFSIVINLIQILAIAALILLVYLTDFEQQDPRIVEFVAYIAGAVVVVGAGMDISHARHSLHMHEQAEVLQEAYGQLESLNVSLRAQRHDFMNHLQVVYSLLEMEDYVEAADYIEKVYGDIQSLSQSLRTAIPAVNALLKVKLAECQKRGIRVSVEITSPWKNLPVPGWEMCRVLGNLIDNAMEALAETQEPVMIIQLREELDAFWLRVINNGPEIPLSVAERVFQPGFTTKRTGQGMGLYIVREIVRRAGGDVTVSSGPGRTVFEGWIPRAASECDETQLNLNN